MRKERRRNKKRNRADMVKITPLVVADTHGEIVQGLRMFKKNLDIAEEIYASLDVSKLSDSQVKKIEMDRKAGRLLLESKLSQLEKSKEYIDGLLESDSSDHDEVQLGYHLATLLSVGSALNAYNLTLQANIAGYQLGMDDERVKRIYDMAMSAVSVSEESDMLLANANDSGIVTLDGVVL